MKNETFKAVYKDGTEEFFYCKKGEIENYMTVANYRKLDHIEYVNRAEDKTKHKHFMI